VAGAVCVAFAVPRRAQPGVGPRLGVAWARGWAFSRAAGRIVAPGSFAADGESLQSLYIYMIIKDLESLNVKMCKKLCKSQVLPSVLTYTFHDAYPGKMCCEHRFWAKTGYWALSLPIRSLLSTAQNVSSYLPAGAWRPPVQVRSPREAIPSVPDAGPAACSWRAQPSLLKVSVANLGESPTTRSSGRCLKCWRKRPAAPLSPLGRETCKGRLQVIE
jgi:hypothetical protein